MELLKNVMKFSQESNELYTAFKDYADEFQHERGVTGKKFSNVSREDKEKVITKLFQDEVARKSGVDLKMFEGDTVRYSRHPLVKTFADDIIERMIDMVLPEVLWTGMASFAEIVYGGWYDSFTFNIENNSLFSVSKAGRRQRTVPAQKLYDTTVTLVPENHEVTVITNYPALLAGRESIARFITKVALSIEADMRNLAYDTFADHMDSSTIPSAFKMTAYTEKALISLCEKVTAFNNGKKAVIIGTHVALKSVLPDALNTRILLDSPYVTVGQIPQFNGYDVIPMTQFADYASDDFSLKLRDDRIFVVSPSGDKIVKLAVQGGTLSNITGNPYDNSDHSLNGTIQKAYTAGVITSGYAGIVELG